MSETQRARERLESYAVMGSVEPLPDKLTPAQQDYFVRIHRLVDELVLAIRHDQPVF